MENSSLLIVHLNTITTTPVEVHPAMDGKVQFVSSETTLRLRVLNSEIEAVKKHIERDWTFKVEAKVTFVEEPSQTRVVES